MTEYRILLFRNRIRNNTWYRTCVRAPSVTRVSLRLLFCQGVGSGGAGGVNEVTGTNLSPLVREWFLHTAGYRRRSPFLVMLPQLGYAYNIVLNKTEVTGGPNTLLCILLNSYEYGILSIIRSCTGSLLQDTCHLWYVLVSFF